MKYLVRRRAHTVFSKIYFDDVKSSDIISWIKYAKKSGIRSRKLDEALSATKQTKEDLIRLFFEIVKESKISLPKSAEKLFQKRALNVAIQYLEGKIDPIIAIRKILIVIQNSDDKDHYFVFIEFCHKYDILVRNLEFQNIHVLEERKIRKELDSLFLSFAESCHGLNLRIQIQKKPLNHIVLARRFNSAVYDKLSILIMDDIIAKSCLNHIQLQEIYKQRNY